MKGTVRAALERGQGDASSGASVTVLALACPPQVIDALRRKLPAPQWRLQEVSLDEVADRLRAGDDPAAVLATSPRDLIFLASEHSAVRRSLIGIAERYDEHEALEALRQGIDDWVSVDQLDLLPGILRREIALTLRSESRRPELSPVASGLVRTLDQPGRLDEYCENLAAAFPVSYVSLLFAEAGGEMVVAGLCAEAVVPSKTRAGMRLPAADVAALAGTSSEAAAGTWRELGLPLAWARHWSPLVIDGRSIGMQLVARPAGDFTAGEMRALDELAVVLALATDRGRTIVRLRRADGVKTEFVRTVSHELRTPLNTVIGYADLLADEAFGPLGDEQRRILRRVGDRARGLLEVIAATLDLPGIDGGRLSLQTRPVSVADLLGDLEADAREWRVRHDLRYHWDIGADLPVIITDPGKLRVLLKNLIANAVKFTDRGGITVRARAKEGGVEVTVEDTGIGIEPEAVHFVFDAFRQANAAATGQYGGVGLGLYIVRRLVGILGGRLRVESEVGVGSKFHVWLPADAD